MNCHMHIIMDDTKWKIFFSKNAKFERGTVSVNVRYS